MLFLAILTSLLTSLQSQRLQSDFTISMATEQTQPLTYQGSITMQGPLFRVTLLDIEAAYDGQTLYMYSDDAKELTLSTPTEEELMQTNPFLYAQALVPQSAVTETTTAEGTQVTLIPNETSAGIVRMTVVVDKNNVPQRLEIKEKDKLTTLRLTNPKLTDHIESKTEFKIEKEGAFVNDLR